MLYKWWLSTTTDQCEQITVHCTFVLTLHDIQSCLLLPPVLTDLLSSLVQQAVHSLQVLETLAPAIDPALSPRLLGLLSNPLLSCVTSGFTAVRHMAARCVAILSKVTIIDSSTP